ncbi:hypothetical protein RI367_006165 [Sorochytrium milnesiophthora]
MAGGRRSLHRQLGSETNGSLVGGRNGGGAPPTTTFWSQLRNGLLTLCKVPVFIVQIIAIVIIEIRLDNRLPSDRWMDEVLEHYYQLRHANEVWVVVCSDKAEVNRNAERCRVMERHDGYLVMACQKGASLDVFGYYRLSGIKIKMSYQ